MQCKLKIFAEEKKNLGKNYSQNQSITGDHKRRKHSDVRKFLSPNKILRRHKSDSFLKRYNVVKSKENAP